jgi:branched-chain amino acid transport system substrate-binding protein
VIAARMAVEDFGAAAKGIKVEIISADHQNKPDIGSNIARQWIDQDGVDGIFIVIDVPRRAMVAKMAMDGSQFVEVVTTGTNAIVSFGACK